MYCLRNYCSLLLVLIVLFACKSKTHKAIANEKVTSSELLNVLQNINLPFQCSDTILNGNAIPGSKTFNLRNLPEIFADSVFVSNFDTTKNISLIFLGKMKLENKFRYVLAIAKNKKKQIVYLFSFDNKNKCVGYITPVDDKFYSNTSSEKVEFEIAINKNSSVTSKFIQLQNGKPKVEKNVYLLNDEGNAFELIMTNKTDSNEQSFVNPIAQLSETTKFAGDYFKNKNPNELLSIRDGKTKEYFYFYIHTESKDGNGELKGNGVYSGKNTGTYKTFNDPCELTFKFSNDKIVVVESGQCGSHRSFKSTFNGTFIKQNKKISQKQKK